MKKIIVCLTVSAFALVSSLHAGDTKTCTDKSMTSSAKGASCCSGGKSACAKMPTKTVLMSPKASVAAGKS